MTVWFCVKVVMLLLYFLLCSVRFHFALGNRIDVQFMNAWYDMWVGLFWCEQTRRLYVFPIPFFGIRIQVRRKR